MKLLRFRVQSFRSIGDTRWIDVDDVTAFIGTNESGKSNILLALWKLNPARDGEIDLKADAPRKRYNEIRNMEVKPVFIEAEFELDDELIDQLVSLTGVERDEVAIAKVARKLDGGYTVGFPQALTTLTLSKIEVVESIEKHREHIESLDLAGKTEQPLKETMLATLSSALTLLEKFPNELGVPHLRQLKTSLQGVDRENGLKTSKITPAYEEFLSSVDVKNKRLTRPAPDSNKEARNLVITHIPKFIYYANYGNLDSEIYLPHVIANMARTDLGSHEAAKARTLKVLFEFVQLKPQEILELGLDWDERQQGQPTSEQIHEIAEKKKERSILLKSASTDLTEKFLNWWRQGNYSFDFEADGKHFRIWVSDSIRPEAIELEGRSAGLQWFLSFFLVFLVERAETHQDAILLLDEPGVSLHPIAQEDLFEFFDELSKENLIVYTSHSPFMVNPDQLDRVRAVYFDETGADKGLTKVSADLRAKEKQKSEERSVYPVHAALELAVSPVLLVGCNPVIVDGTSDQYYLSAIKNYLISKGHITPQKEMLFLPSGSFKGIKAVIPIIAGRDESLPFIILDADKPGLQTETQLKSSLYQGDKDKIVMLSEICGFAEAEIEDLLPTSLMAYILTRYLRSAEEEFEDVVVSNQPLVPQVEAYAKKHGIELSVGWKVEVAKRVKERMIKQPASIANDDPCIERWKNLFAQLLSGEMAGGS